MKGVLRRFSSVSWRGLLLGCVAFSLWARPAQGSYRVTSLRCSAVPAGAEVILEASGPIEYSSFTMGEPESRLVVDLSEAVHALPQHRYSQTGTDLISRVRTSQYQPYPQPTMRVVLDLPRLLPYQIRAEDHRLTIALYGPAGEDVGPAPSQLDSTADHRGKPPVPQDVQKQGPPPPAEDAMAEAQFPRVAMAAEESSAANAPGPSQSLAATMTVASLDSILATTSADSASQTEEETLLSRLAALGIREPVTYLSDGRRDPFVSLPAGQETEFGQAPLPDIEKLAIVGILEGVNGYRALAQDDQDNGYVLRKGDRVLYGYVARVEAERVVFRLNQRGLDRTVILKLPQ